MRTVNVITLWQLNLLVSILWTIVLPIVHWSTLLWLVYRGLLDVCECSCGLQMALSTSLYWHRQLDISTWLAPLIYLPLGHICLMQLVACLFVVPHHSSKLYPNMSACCTAKAIWNSGQFSWPSIWDLTNFMKAFFEWLRVGESFLSFEV